MSVRARIKLGERDAPVVRGHASIPRRQIMGRFDSRKTKKTRQRRAQSSKQAREARRADETRAARQAKA